MQLRDDATSARLVRGIDARAEVGDIALRKQPAVAAGNVGRQEDVGRSRAAGASGTVICRVSTSCVVDLPMARPTDERGPSAPTTTPAR